MPAGMLSHKAYYKISLTLPYIRMSAANVVKMTYGYDIESDDDKLIRAAVESSARTTKAGVPGIHLKVLIYTTH